MNPYQTLFFESYSLPKDQLDTAVFINYQQKTFLDFGGKSCMDVEDYDYEKCIEKSIHEVRSS